MCLALFNTEMETAAVRAPRSPFSDLNMDEVKWGELWECAS